MHDIPEISKFQFLHTGLAIIKVCPTNFLLTDDLSML